MVNGTIVEMQCEHHEQDGAADITAVAETDAVLTPPLAVESLEGRTAAVDTTDNSAETEPPKDPEVYDPTPVIRGYDVIESAASQPSEKSDEPLPAAPPSPEPNAPQVEALAVGDQPSFASSGPPAVVEPAALQAEAAPIQDVSTPPPPDLDTRSVDQDSHVTPVLETVAVESSVPETELTTDIEKTTEPAPLDLATTTSPSVPATAQPTGSEPVKCPNEVPPQTSAPVVDPVAAKVRETWSLMFSSRYEDDDQDEEPAQPVAASSDRNSTRAPRCPEKSHSSLRAKLDRERRLDAQIQRSTRSTFKPSPMISTRQADPALTAKPSRRRPKPAGWLEEDRPFEDAGLLPTAVRFCMEKAMLEAVRCLGELHAIAQDEPKPVPGDIALGLFITQWELNQILNDLFADPTTPASAAATNLHLHNPEYATLPLETLLRVSWFLPLDQFARLRVMVAEISRKRLGEAKLAILNAALHRHYVLRPHPGVRMQRLLLRVVRAMGPALEKEKSNQNENGGNDSNNLVLVVELLRALHIRIPASECDTAITVVQFMQLDPFELARRYQLTSVVAVQRVVFFRFFIEALAAQIASQTSGKNVWWPRSTGKPHRALERRSSEIVSEASTPLRSTAKRKKKPQRPQVQEAKDPEEPELPPDYEHTDGGSDRGASASSGATHGSVGSPHQEPKAPLNAVEGPDAGEGAAFAKLNGALTAALTSLVRANPWLVEDQEASLGPPSPTTAATRASFLAAETFQQSLVLLSSSSAPVAPSILAKMEDFTSLITNLATQRADKPKTKPSESPPPYALREEPLPEPSKPTPRPVQRANSGSFPPPYVSTKPAYWTFEPEVPTAATPTPSIPRSVSKAQASPGVGDYDVARSDKLTFQQRAGHSFAKGGLPSVEETTEKKSTPVRRYSMSTTRAVQGSDSMSSLDPPSYTHWASAALGTGQDNDDDAADEDAIDVQVRDALRLQQSFVLDDLVSNLLHRGKSVANSRSMPQPPRRHPLDRPQSVTTVKHETKRPSTSRVVSRVRTIATARVSAGRETVSPSKSRGGARSPKRAPPPPYAPAEPKVSPVKQPPRDYEPPADDAHLHWAARVSEFYKAKLKATAADQVVR